ncbi:MAG: RNA polymerase sigma factor [Cyclobacteriaceae bacterium]
MEPAHASFETIVAHFFRHEYGKTVAYLTKVFGAGQIERIEDAVQDTLLKATKLWPYQGIPNNPSAWIIKVTRNKVIDLLRKDQRLPHASLEHMLPDTEMMEEPRLSGEINDDLLRMIFTCCDPINSRESQIILTLKILCGFSKAEIASSLLKKEDAVAKAYTRAKQRLKSNAQAMEVPTGEALKARLGMVLKIIYLLFNEGYSASDGDRLIKKSLCEEAIRLNQIMVDHKHCQDPRSYALMALMYFHMARFDSRSGEEGELLTLEKQDRRLWDQKLIDIGRKYFALASRSGEGSQYLIQAGMAALHALAPSYDETDWEELLKLYDLQLELQASPIVALNRVVVYYKVYGAEAALKVLEKIPVSGYLSNYNLYYAIRGELLAEVGDHMEAISHYKEALKYTRNGAQHQHITKKINHLELLL